jgi:hypothetical protein
VKLFKVKPFSVEDLTKFPPRHWSLYLFGFLCLFIGCLALSWRWYVRVGGVSPTEGDVALVYTFVGLLGVWTGVVCFATGRVAKESADSNDELTKRLTEQEERIRSLEAQVAALTPPAPAP